MTNHHLKQRLILCAGLQSGGTTLISWCFLQRRDTNGVLDMPHDILQVSFDQVAEPIVWCKMVVSSFRWSDVSSVYRDLGWTPEPLLVVRDTRAVFASLLKKNYGFNGVTAEQPPLRMRFRRFLEDWETFRTNNWPILKYEDFIDDHTSVLTDTCGRLRLDWDDAMLAWPKKLRDIAYIFEPSGAGENGSVRSFQATFMKSIQQGSLSAAKLHDRNRLGVDRLPQAELEWLEETFSEYNAFHGYPAHVPASQNSFPMHPPRFEGTTREWYYNEVERLRIENQNLSDKLIELQDA